MCLSFNSFNTEFTISKENKYSTVAPKIVSSKERDEALVFCDF